MTIVYDFADIAARMNHKPVRTEPVAPTGTGSVGCHAWDDNAGGVVWVPAKPAAGNPAQEPGPAIGDEWSISDAKNLLRQYQAAKNAVYATRVSDRSWMKI